MFGSKSSIGICFNQNSSKVPSFLISMWTTSTRTTSITKSGKTLRQSKRLKPRLGEILFRSCLRLIISTKKNCASLLNLFPIQIKQKNSPQLEEFPLLMAMKKYWRRIVALKKVMLGKGNKIVIGRRVTNKVLPPPINKEISLN